MSTQDQSSPPEPSWAKVDAGAHDRTLAENWLFRLRSERYRSRQSGKTHDFFVAQIADGVHAIAITPERQVILARQFRAGAGRDSLETPGGLIEPGEDPVVAGARELLEETGYAGQASLLLGPIYPNPALLTMRITTIIVHNAKLIAPQHLDAAEEVAIELVPVAGIPSMIEAGKIDHAVCVAGLLWWLAHERSEPVA